MINETSGWNRLKFNTKEEARLFCVSNEYNKHINYLKGLSFSLIENSQYEVSIVMGHGYPSETPSSFRASLVNDEIDRLKGLYDYFNNKPEEGYVFIYEESNHKVYTQIDKSKLTLIHPDFISFISKSNKKLTLKQKQEAFNIWRESVLNPTITNTFKLAYYFKLNDIIPEKIKFKTLDKIR